MSYQINPETQRVLESLLPQNQSPKDATSTITIMFPHTERAMMNQDLAVETRLQHGTSNHTIRTFLTHIEEAGVVPHSPLQEMLCFVADVEGTGVHVIHEILIQKDITSPTIG